MTGPDIEGTWLAEAAHDAACASWPVRAAAGRRLAAAAGRPGVAAVLHRLLLDARDTAVIRQTAQALLERDDTDGLRLVLAALGTADDQQADWLHTALEDTYGRSPTGPSRLRALCGQLAAPGEDPAVRLQALLLTGPPRPAAP